MLAHFVVRVLLGLIVDDEQDLPELSDDDGVLPFTEVLVGKCRVSPREVSQAHRATTCRMF
jgi:hypothetical protein